MTALDLRDRKPLGNLMQLIESSWPLSNEWSGQSSIRLEDELTDDRYTVRAEAPGMDPDKDIRVSVRDGILTIAGTRQKKSEGINRSEFYYGSFSRSLALPSRVSEEDISARYADGVLEVSFPYQAEKPVEHMIEIEH